MEVDFFLSSLVEYMGRNDLGLSQEIESIRSEIEKLCTKLTFYVHSATNQKEGCLTQHDIFVPPPVGLMTCRPRTRYSIEQP